VSLRNTKWGRVDDTGRKLTFAVAWHAWQRRVLLLVISLPVAVILPKFVTARWSWVLNVGMVPFVLLFCGCAAALWIFGLRPDVLALPLAFSAAFFYFTPGAFAFLSGHDFLRVAIALGIIAAPMRMAWRMNELQAAWSAANLPTLDGWRAIAIMLVLLDHLAGGIARDKQTTPSALFLHGQTGVNIFFALSGLLITWKLLEEQQQTGKVSLAHFYCRRVYRIFPAAFAYLSVMGLLSLAGWLPTTRLDLAAAVLYFRNFIPLAWPSFSNAHFWSLSLEEQFYLFLPVTLLGLGVRRFRFLAVALVTLCGAWRWYYFNMMAAPDPGMSIRFRTDFRIDGLLCGCLMAIALQNEDVRSDVRRVLATPAWLVLLAAFAGLAYRAGEYTLLAESVTLPLLVAGTMLSPRALPARILEWKPLRWVGKISYSLYLWQEVFLLCPLKPRLLQPLHRFPLNIIATFACAALSYYLVELPMVRRGRRRLTTSNNVSLRAAAAAAAAG
jgi:peptidoglycan/LPS O-acetylase OafA/YrhL